MQYTVAVPSNFKTLLDQNPNVTTAGRGKPPAQPYGYRDWWPPALGFNNLEPPFDDPDIRWAVNYAIDRDSAPWPSAGRALASTPCCRSPTSPAADALYQPSSGSASKVSSGETRPSPDRSHHGAQGLEQRCGRYVAAERRAPEWIPVVVFPSLFQDFTPVLVEQLRRAGFDSSFRMFSDAYTRMTQGYGPRLYHGQRRLSARPVLHPAALPQPLRPTHRHGYPVLSGAGAHGPTRTISTACAKPSIWLAEMGQTATRPDLLDLAKLVGARF